MLDIVKVTSFLMLVCVLSAVAMSMTDSQTRPIIDEQKRKTAEAARREVMPAAANFEEISGSGGLLRGVDASGKTVGFVGTAEGRGFGGKVLVMAGVDLQGKVVGTKVLSHTETPGLGNRAADPEGAPIKSMAGLTVESAWLSKDRAGQGKVDSITGVTVTSRAVTEAVRKVLEKVKEAGQR